MVDLQAWQFYNLLVILAAAITTKSALDPPRSFLQVFVSSSAGAYLSLTPCASSEIEVVMIIPTEMRTETAVVPSLGSTGVHLRAS
jgi:hypothetical protein